MSPRFLLMADLPDPGLGMLREAGEVVRGGLAGRVRQVRWEELVETADVLSLHVPLTEDTRHLVDEDVIARMKDDAVLVNTARGPVVDEAALVTALREGRLFGAGFDVGEDEPAMAEGLARNAIGMATDGEAPALVNPEARG